MALDSDWLRNILTKDGLIVLFIYLRKKYISKQSTSNRKIV